MIRAKEEGAYSTMGVSDGENESNTVGWVKKSFPGMVLIILRAKIS